MSASQAEFSAELVASDGTRHALAGEMYVGRSKDCEIAIDDTKVSRKHALISVADDSVTIEDQGSANGTLVNGTRIGGKTELRNGDTLQFEKHQFAVEISGQEEPEVDPDATVVDAGADEDDDATVVSGFAEPPPPPPPEPPPAPAPSPDLPGAWVDDPSMGEHTQVMDFSGGGPDSPKSNVARLSDEAHLIELSASGDAIEASELVPAGEGKPDTWEIGRDPACEVVLPRDPSVSGRHAQVVHDGGRWKVVNLLAANGVFVNGEKRLSAFLSDGDELRLGSTTVVFYAPVGGAAAAPASPSPKAEKAAAGGSGRMVKIVVGVVAVLLLAGVAGYFLL